MTALLLLALWVNPADEWSIEYRHARYSQEKPDVVEFELRKWDIPRPDIWGDHIDMRLDLPGEPKWVTLHNNKALGLAWNPIDGKWVEFVDPNENVFWGTASSNKVDGHYNMDTLYCGKLPPLRVSH